MSTVKTKEKCDDYEYFQQKKDAPEYVMKGYKKVWLEDEDLNKKIKCMDESHSKSRCISEDALNKLESDLKGYTKAKGDLICRSQENAVLQCILQNQKIFECYYEITEFQHCVNLAAQHLNKPTAKEPES